MGKKYRSFKRKGNDLIFIVVPFIFAALAVYALVVYIMEDGITANCLIPLILIAVTGGIGVGMMRSQKKRKNLLENGLLLQGRVTEIYYNDSNNSSSGRSNYTVRCIYEDPSTGKRYEGVNRNCTYWYKNRIDIGDSVDVYVDCSNFDKCYVDVERTVEKQIG